MRERKLYSTYNGLRDYLGSKDKELIIEEINNGFVVYDRWKYTIDEHLVADFWHSYAKILDGILFYPAYRNREEALKVRAKADFFLDNGYVPAGKSVRYFYTKHSAKCGKKERFNIFYFKKDEEFVSIIIANGKLITSNEYELQDKSDYVEKTDWDLWAQWDLMDKLGTNEQEIIARMLQFNIPVEVENKARMLGQYLDTELQSRDYQKVYHELFECGKRRRYDMMVDLLSKSEKIKGYAMECKLDSELAVDIEKWIYFLWDMKNLAYNERLMYN